MSNPANPIPNSALAPPKPMVVLGLCLGAMLCAACSFDASKLQAPSARPRDAAALPPSTLDAARWDEAGDAGRPNLGGDAGPDEPSALAAGGDADRIGDGPAALEVYRASGDDTRDPGSDSAGAMGSPDADGPADMGRDRGDVLMGDSTDASLPIDAGGADEGTNPTVDAPDDISSSADGVMTGSLDMEGTGDDARDLAAAEDGGFDWDAPVDMPDDALVNTPDDVPADTPDAAAVPADSADDAGLTIDPDLVLWYPFDESSGTIAYDSAQFGGVARHATVATVGFGGSATFSTASKVGTHALALSPAMPASSGGGYVIIPAFDTLAPDALTIAVWVNLAAATPSQMWERIFDFADSSTSPAWLNLTARNQTSPYGPLFNMSNIGHNTGDQQRLAGPTALGANTWYHIAVVLPAGATYTGVMYVNGVVAASNSAMTLHLSDIGATANNWLGRSAFSSDPYFYGSFDDFRVYRRALSQEEIVALMALR